MTLYLHIGTMKTGTSSIQDFLYINREKIKQQGFLYPISIKSLWHMNDHNNFADQFSMKLFGLNSNFDYLLQSFKQELHNENVHTSIISTENIQYELNNPQKISELQEILRNIGFTKIYIIVYLRDPQDLYISMCSQEVKDGGRYDFLQGPDKYVKCGIICNHKQTIMNWSEVFGEENVIVKLFDKNEFIENDLLKDFANTVEIQWDNTFQIPNTTNESLDLIGMELLNRMNQIGVTLNNNRYVELIHGLFEKYFISKSPELKYRPPKHILQHYVDYFKDSNEWVRNKYFPQKISLFKQQVSSTYVENCSLSNVKAEYWDRISECIAYIITTKNNTIKQKEGELEKKIEELKQMSDIEILIKLSLEYRFGQTLMNATHKWRKLVLPFALLCVYISNKQEQSFYLKYSKKKLRGGGGKFYPPPPRSFFLEYFK